MEQISDLLTDSLWPLVALGLLIFGATVFIMRRRLAHLAEPAMIQSFVLSFGFAGFYLLYDPHDYSWWAIVLGSVLGVAPFVLFYRRSFARDEAIFEKRAKLARSTEFRIFVVAACSCIIVEGLIAVLSSGLTIGPKFAPALLFRQGGPIVYMSQAALSFVPAFILLTYRTRLFYVVIGAMVINFLAATFGQSRASFLWPALMIGGALFLRKLDRYTAEGWPTKTVMTLKNLSLGVVGIICAFGLLYLAGLLATGTPGAFLFSFLMRLFQSFDCLLIGIKYQFVTPHAAPEYSIWMSYAHPLLKVVHIDAWQLYNNIGEYVAVHVYHFDIWANPDLKFLALPNSNLVLEFELSYPLATALVLIPLYSTAIICLMNWSERRRYNSLGLFCLSQYLIMTALEYFSDGNFFIVAAYGAVMLFFVAKIGGVVVDLIRSAYLHPRVGPAQSAVLNEEKSPRQIAS